jgi:hypothetical protein
MLSCSGLAEESVKGIIPSSDGLVAWHLAIWLNAMLQTKKFPACVTDLNATLTEVKAEDLAHDCKEKVHKLMRAKVRTNLGVCRVM